MSLFPWLLFEYMERQQKKKDPPEIKDSAIAGISEFMEPMSFSMNAFSDALDSAELVLDSALPSAVCSALHAKAFLILTGLAGSGKTQLARAFSKWITKKYNFFSTKCK